MLIKYYVGIKYYSNFSLKLEQIKRLPELPSLRFEFFFCQYRQKTYFQIMAVNQLHFRITQNFTLTPECPQKNNIYLLRLLNNPKTSEKIHVVSCYLHSSPSHPPQRSSLRLFRFTSEKACFFFFPILNFRNYFRVLTIPSVTKSPTGNSCLIITIKNSHS